MMEINNKFNIGQTVYSKTDPEQREWLVNQIIVGQSSIDYKCSHIDASAVFEDYEISTEKDMLKSCGIVESS